MPVDPVEIKHSKAAEERSARTVLASGLAYFMIGGV